MTYVPKEDMYLKQYQARDIWDNRHTYISETFKGWVQRGNVLGSGMSYPKGTVDAFNHSKIQSVLQDNVIEINTGKNLYKFITFYSWDGNTFGFPPNSFGCWQRVNVYKNYNLIDTIYSWDGTNRVANFNRKYYYYDDASEKSGVMFQFAENNDAYASGGGEWCNYFFNNYQIIYSEEDFIIDVSTPSEYFIQGDNVIVLVNITNNLNYEVLSNVSARFYTPTLFGGQHYIDTRTVILYPGLNNLEYVLFAATSEAILDVEVNATINVFSHHLQNLNYYWGGYIMSYCHSGTLGGYQYDPDCRGWAWYSDGGAQRNVNIDGSVDVGRIVEKKDKIRIIPRPLYYVKGVEACVEGYTINTNGDYCLLDAVKDLSCAITGCPIGYDPPYQCTSSGQCAQTVYVALVCDSDEFCVEETGGIAPKCDTGSGFCFDEIIYEKVIQCQTANDCLVPCIGMTAQCLNNKCEYSGKCINQPIPTDTSFNLWQLIQEVWDSFWNWVKSLFI